MPDVWSLVRNWPLILNLDTPPHTHIIPQALDPALETKWDRYFSHSSGWLLSKMQVERGNRAVTRGNRTVGEPWKSKNWNCHMTKQSRLWVCSQASGYYSSLKRVEVVIQATIQILWRIWKTIQTLWRILLGGVKQSPKVNAVWFLLRFLQQFTETE